MPRDASNRVSRAKVVRRSRFNTNLGQLRGQKQKISIDSGGHTHTKIFGDLGFTLIQTLPHYRNLSWSVWKGRETPNFMRNIGTCYQETDEHTQQGCPSGFNNMGCIEAGKIKLFQSPLGANSAAGDFLNMTKNYWFCGCFCDAFDRFRLSTLLLVR